MASIASVAATRTRSAIHFSSPASTTAAQSAIALTIASSAILSASPTVPERAATARDGSDHAAFPAGGDAERRTAVVELTRVGGSSATRRRQVRCGAPGGAPHLYCDGG